MQLNLATVDIENPDLIEGYVRLVLHSALGDHAQKVQSARVRLVDVNGPELGGIDKHCWIALRLKTGPDVVAASVHAEAEGAISLTAAELARMVARRVKAEGATERCGQGPVRVLRQTSALPTARGFVSEASPKTKVIAAKGRSPMIVGDT